jgi:pimeloyl-ACP methyl ester carboxylesterase
VLTAHSRDDTPIAYWRSGSGPPLLLVHGVIADHVTTWRYVLPKLEQHFTVYAMDRRGRGASGDSPSHSLQQEAEDVAAVIDAIGEPMFVFGHSYGAVCAFEAALLTPCVRRLVLYEGIPLRGADYYRTGTIEELESLRDSRDLDRLVVTMLRDVASVPAREIDILRLQTDSWARRLANSVSMPRELRAEQQFVFDAQRYTQLRMPILFLVGGDSPDSELVNARSVAATLADARVTVMPGQQHIAMHTNPALFLDSFVPFLLQAQ